ncbi:hypothetical protein [Thorsellia anophelis]|uniref:Helix-turn-helix n=1 Tax=Thorsellia anophelis DSM 18579 TaxID=1123402 RepID=A0A1I0FPI4_9GAMM|nr:hypothetical protein [Thorsellia anophelis]SET60349.1 hypothetical protein SAMN02583745_02856 [Thorsellia anophelis DSM 18579]
MSNEQNDDLPATKSIKPEKITNQTKQEMKKKVSELYDRDVKSASLKDGSLIDIQDKENYSVTQKGRHDVYEDGINITLTPDTNLSREEAVEKLSKYPITQEKIAVILGVSQSTVSKINTGQTLVIEDMSVDNTPKAGSDDA